MGRSSANLDDKESTVRVCFPFNFKSGLSYADPKNHPRHNTVAFNQSYPTENNSISNFFNRINNSFRRKLKKKVRKREPR